MPGANENVDEIITQRALQGFDLLNEKVTLAVTNLERMIATGVDLNKAFGPATVSKKQMKELPNLWKWKGSWKK